MIAPGIYPDLDEAAYRADPALGSTDVNRLLRAPALYAWHREHPQPATDAMDVGSALHSLLLGGRSVIAVDAPDWRTASARAERDRIRASGAIPLLADQARQVHDMADAVLAAAGDLVTGSPEASGFATHVVDGIEVRVKGRADVLHDTAIVDLKTTTDASPDALKRSILRYGYHIQAAHYLDIFAPEETHDYLIVAVEKSPPYLVTVALLDADWIDLGRRRCADAYAAWAACTATGHWPGYAAGVVVLDLPPWADRTHDLEVI